MSGQREPGEARAQERGAPARRRLLKGVTWAAPTVVAATAAPAYAASQNDIAFGVLFDGGGGSNGFQNSMYLNFGVVSGGAAPFTLKEPIVLTIDVVGLNPNTTAERSFSAGTSYGTVSRAPYSTTTRTTTITWTLPAGMTIPALSTASNVPDALFSFRDGLAGTQRISNKVVVRSISGARLTQPSSVPVDSSVVKDVDRNAVSPDGIY